MVFLTLILSTTIIINFLVLILKIEVNHVVEDSEEVVLEVEVVEELALHAPLFSAKFVTKLDMMQVTTTTIYNLNMIHILHSMVMVLLVVMVVLHLMFGFCNVFQVLGVPLGLNPLSFLPTSLGKDLKHHKAC